MKQCISTSALLTSIFIFIALIFMMPMSAQAANTPGDYVGYYGPQDSKVGSQQLYSLYVTEKSNYDANGVKNKDLAEVAYCFNKSREWPRNDMYGWWWKKDSLTKKVEYKVKGYIAYNKLSNVTGASFADIAPKRRNISEDEFRKKILSIGLNGYPYDYSGFNKDDDGNQILDDYTFRALTQYAIWYYTDSNEISESDMDFIGWTQNDKRIYYQLINTTLPQYITDRVTSAIDLYLWDGNPAFDASSTIYLNGDENNTTTGYTDPYANNPDKYYQNLLVVHTNALTNIVALSDPITLTLSKATTGSSGGSFTFDIKLGANTIYWVNEQTADNVKDYGNGHVTVTLKNGESVSLKIEGDSFDYSIEETNASDYDTSISVKKGVGTISSTNSKLISGTNVATDTSILYTNTALNEPTRYPMYFIDDDDSDDDDDEEEEEEREREYENMDEETKTIWEEYMESRYGDDITVDRHGYVWKDNNIVDTIPSKKGSPDFTKKTVKLTEGETVPNDETTPDTSPKTADSSNLAFWLWLMVICGSVLARKLRSRMK